MFPISKEKLTFREIADYWSREIWPPAPANELLDIIVRAWWLGELVGYAPPRFELLKKMAGKRNKEDELTNLIFVTPEDVPPPTKQPPSGNTYVDIRPRVPVPSMAMEAWDDALCEDAFSVLASDEVSHTDHYLEWGVMIQWFALSRTEFLNWLALRSYPLPTFWGTRGSIAHKSNRRKKGTRPATLHRHESAEPDSSATPPAAPRKQPNHRRGPRRGTVARYDEADRALFPKMEALIPQKGSARAAARQLAWDNKVAGAGTYESIAKRLERKYLQHKNSLLLAPTKSH
jgi:hypothetical protein